MSDTPQEPCQGEENAPSAPQRSSSLVVTLTCKTSPPGGVSDRGENSGVASRPAVVAGRCVRRRLVPGWGGGWRWIPCGRPRCSWQCRNLWARRMSAALRRSVAVLPPTHFLTLAVLDPIGPKELTRCVGRVLRRLRYRGCEYLCVSEWREGRRHHHVLVRIAGELTGVVVAGLWRASCPGVRARSYCRPVRSAEASVRYIVKDMKNGSKKEVPPAEFSGRLFSYSGHFLAEPLKVLMRAVVKEWRSQARNRSETRSNAEKVAER